MPLSFDRFCGETRTCAPRKEQLGADAVIICIQRAIDSRQAPPDQSQVGDALQVASDIINNAVEALEAAS